jgi:hypothetical protein
VWPSHSSISCSGIGTSSAGMVRAHSCATLLASALLASLATGSSGSTPALAVSVAAPNATKYTCNATLGKCVACAPDDPELPPWSQKCNKFHLNETKCDEVCHTPTPKDFFWICNTETHKCEAGPFAPHYQTESECSQKCAATVPKVSPLREHRRAAMRHPPPPLFGCASRCVCFIIPMTLSRLPCVLRSLLCRGITALGMVCMRSALASVAVSTRLSATARPNAPSSQATTDTPAWQVRPAPFCAMQSQAGHNFLSGQRNAQSELCARRCSNQEVRGQP